MALRASFLIDRAGIVQHQVVNNLALGREVDEMIRLIEALQFTEEHGEVCPAGWRKGPSGRCTLCSSSGDRGFSGRNDFSARSLEICPTRASRRGSFLFSRVRMIIMKKW